MKQARDWTTLFLVGWVFSTTHAASGPSNGALPPPPPPPKMDHFGNAESSKMSDNSNWQSAATKSSSLPPPPPHKLGEKETTTTVANLRAAFEASHETDLDMNAEHDIVRNDIVSQDASTKRENDVDENLSDGTKMNPPKRSSWQPNAKPNQNQLDKQDPPGRALQDLPPPQNSLPPPPSRHEPLRPNPPVQSMQQQQQQQQQQIPQHPDSYKAQILQQPQQQQQAGGPTMQATMNQYTYQPNYQNPHPSLNFNQQHQQSQQQQSHQQLRPPPNGQRLPPTQYGSNQRPQQQPQRPQQGQPQARQKPAWLRIWRKIEGGLDSLADLEDSVAGQASKLYSATVEGASSAMKMAPVQQLTKVVAVTRNRESTRDDLDSFHTKASIREQQTVFRRREQKRGPGVPESSQPQESLLQRHAAMRQQQQQDRQQQQQQTATLSPGQGSATPNIEARRKMDWNVATATGSKSAANNRPKVANGGASSFPNGNAPPPPAQQQQQSQQQQKQQQPPPQQGVNQRPNPPQPTAAFPNAMKMPQHKTANVARVKVQRPEPSGNAKPFQQQQQQQQTKPQYPTKTPNGPAPVSRPSFDDDDDTWAEKLGRLVPRMPSFKFLRFRQNSYGDYSSTLDAWSAEDGDDRSSKGLFGFWRRKKTGSQINGSQRFSRAKRDDSPNLTPTVKSLMGRCEQEEKTNSLLESSERKKCVGLGRKRALFDLITIFFVLQASRAFAEADALALGRSATSFANAAVSIGVELMKGWFPHAAAAALLSILTNALLMERASLNQAVSIGHQVINESQYGSLFLRLVSSTATDTSTIQQVGATAQAQALARVESVRLRTSALCLLATLVLMTLSFVQPLLRVTGSTIVDVVALPEWRTWPLAWKALWGSIQHLIKQFLHYVHSAVSLEFKDLAQSPMRFAYDASLFVVLLLITQIPGWEMKRKVQGIAINQDEDAPIHEQQKQAGILFNMGASSATRLQIAAKRSALDQVLERWHNVAPIINIPTQSSSIKSLLYYVSYGIVSGLLLCIPVLVHAYVGVSGDASDNNSLVRWDSLQEVAIVFIYTQVLLLKSIGRAVDASGAKKYIVQFLSDFTSAVKERKAQLTAPPANLPLQASISHVAGISVHDLWAAHSARRAWGVRGANLACRSGELVVVLGDDGAGRSRLLGTLAEAILSPPKQAQTATRVRGAISIGGLDTTKWDPNQLRRRVGLVLNDVRTIGDSSRMLSGLTIEEIMDPSDGLQSLSPSYSPGPSEQACMMLALKMTGLYNTLLPRLPSKLTTVVTGNEEDIYPSSLHPHYHILSPTEWSKLLLARVICQAIYDNDNAASSNDKVENSLVGSVLLFDDATNQFSETDEARLIKALKASAAATVISSNRWAIGRFADRIVVLKNGAVVEDGTHTELLARGPQNSMYAAKWNAMTSA